MKKKYFLKSFLMFGLLIAWNITFGQFLNPEVFNKPYPEIIEVGNQPDDFRFTTHIVNIKVPQNVADNWSIEIEKQYIQTLFNFIDDKEFVVSNYDGFYFPSSSGLASAHNIRIKNDVANIGAPFFDNSSDYNSTKLQSITRLEEGWYMRPKIVTHEIMHQWNTYLESALYWLVDPTNHTGLIEESTSCFENYRNTFEHVQNDIYSYRQWFSGGFVGQYEGYLAGLWDAPSSLRTLKNYFHDPSLPSTNMGDYTLVQVFADEIYDIPKAELFSVHGGERVPNYTSSQKEFDAVAIVFSLDNFLDDDNIKAYHYASIVNEIEEPDSEYNSKYDEVYILQNHPSTNHPTYGRRQLNPYHASYKNLNFNTRLFEGTLSNDVFSLEDEIRIFPNPASNFLNIFTKNNIYSSAKIYSIQGKEILSSNLSNIDVSALSNGLYFVEIKTDSGILTKKFMKK